MNKKEIAKLACRILSVYNIVKAASLVFMSLYGSNLTTFLQFSPSFILLFALGIVLWLAADQLAGAMISDFDTQEGATGFSIEDAYNVAFATLGLFVLATALPELISSVMKIYIADQIRFSGIKQTSIIGVIQYTVQLLIGLGLFAGSRGLVRIVRTLREAGYKEHKDIED